MTYLFFKRTRLYGTLSLSLLSSWSLYAMMPADLYVSGEAGYSSSYHANFAVTSPGTGYVNPTRNISGSFGHSGVYSVALGYYFLPILRADVSYSVRPGFEYNQTDSDPATNRQREFDILNQTLMASAYLNLNSLPIIKKNKLDFLSPYVGVGIGSAWNNTGQLNAKTASTGEVRSNPIAGANTANFAWQLMGGTLFHLNSRLLVEIGYRYVNIGRIAVSDHYTNTIERPQLISVLSASSAAVQDIFAGLHYRFE